MRRLGVAVLVGVAVLGCGLGAQAHHWNAWPSVTGYLYSSGDADYWYFTLQEGVKYKFTLSMPYNADYDMKLYRDFNHDGYFNNNSYWDTFEGELYAYSTSFGERPETMETTSILTGRFDIKLYSSYGSGSYTFAIYEWSDW